MVRVARCLAAAPVLSVLLVLGGGQLLDVWMSGRLDVWTHDY
jgi:hypothetical protein